MSLFSRIYFPVMAVMNLISKGGAKCSGSADVWCQKDMRKVEFSNDDIARECLRQIYQIFDAGGHSFGRSPESELLETAMDLLPKNNPELSKIADTDICKFTEIIREARYFAIQKRIDDDNIKNKFTLQKQKLK